MHLVFYNTFSEREEFELTEGSRPWDILLILSQGAFSITFPRLEQTVTVAPHEIVYIPAGEYFQRTVLSPIGFHQFAILPSEDSPFSSSLRAGKLHIPQEHVRSMIQSMDRIALLPENRPLLLHSVEHILAEEQIFGGGCQANPERLSDDILYVIRFMNDHLGEKLTIPQLAEIAHLSHTGLLWKFHRQLGTTPSQYLIMLRLRSAKQMLLEGQLSVNEIAARCGYSNAYYFTNAFREDCGVCPTEFRKRYLNQTGSSRS
jgi:AraC-like DNA-binding protein